MVAVYVILYVPQSPASSITAPLLRLWAWGFQGTEMNEICKQLEDCENQQQHRLSRAHAWHGVQRLSTAVFRPPSGFRVCGGFGYGVSRAADRVWC